MLNTFYDRLFLSVGASSLAFFRISFGILMLVEISRFFINDWINSHFISPQFHFTYFGFDWIKPLPGDLMYFHFIGLGILAVFILFGFKYRISTILFFIGFSYVFLIEKALYLNHFYLIILISFILIFLPANKTFSLDAKLISKIRSTTIPAYSLWILRIQIGLVYFYGGIAKINSDWLQGEPLRSWLSGQTDFPLIGSYFVYDWVVYLFSYGSLLIDLLAFPLLLIRKTRLAMFCILMVFHILNAGLFEIGIFPPFMIAATLIFFSSEWPRSILSRIKKMKNIENPKIQSVTNISSKQKIGLAFMVVFIVTQSVIPLQHHLYPGNVMWTEEGLNFSWHMMLRDKDTTKLEFYVTAPLSNQTWTVIPNDLTTMQLIRMSYQPDLILQYSHYLEEQFSGMGYEQIEVKANVISSLHGRDPQYLIDPNVDLANQERNLSHANWITPLI